MIHKGIYKHLIEQQWRRYRRFSILKRLRMNTGFYGEFEQSCGWNE